MSMVGHAPSEKVRLSKFQGQKEGLVGFQLWSGKFLWQIIPRAGGVEKIQVEGKTKPQYQEEHIKSQVICDPEQGLKAEVTKPRIENSGQRRVREMRKGQFFQKCSEITEHL